jgi:hypothetical protein
MWRLIVGIVSFALALGFLLIVAREARRRGWEALDLDESGDGDPRDGESGDGDPRDGDPRDGDPRDGESRGGDGRRADMAGEDDAHDAPGR